MFRSWPFAAVAWFVAYGHMTALAGGSDRPNQAKLNRISARACPHMAPVFVHTSNGAPSSNAIAVFISTPMYLLRIEHNINGISSCSHLALVQAHPERLIKGLTGVSGDRTWETEDEEGHLIFGLGSKITITLNISVTTRHMVDLLCWVKTVF